MNPYLTIYLQGAKDAIAAYVEGTLPEGTTARTHLMLSLVRLQRPTGELLPTLEDCAAEELRELRGQVSEALEMVDYIGQRGEMDEGTARDRAIERVPEHLRGGLLRFVDEHILPGDFLTAVLSNDLKDAFGRADIKSRAGMYDVLAFIYNHAPGHSWGSPELVKRWITPAIPTLDRPPLGEPLQPDAEGQVVCPLCHGRHALRRVRAEPHQIHLATDIVKTAHILDYVWCRHNAVPVGVNGRELTRVS